MFKDLPEGQTHSFSECCKECEEWKPNDKRLSRVPCKHCPCHNKPSPESWEEEFFQRFQRTNDRYLPAMNQHQDIKSFISSLLATERKRVIEEVEGMVEKYWQFSDEQQPLSSWHEKQSLKAKLQSMK